MFSIMSRRSAVALATLALFGAPTLASAQARPVASPGAAIAAAPMATAKVPEGTELRIRFNDALSSGKNSEGDQFSISLDEPVTLPDGTVLKAGYRGKGEVTQAKKKGFMGQPGEMNVRFDYLKVGDARIHVRGQKGGSGDASMGATIALTVLFGPLGLLKHGHDIEIKAGQVVTAFVDEDARIDTPVAPPPTSID